MKELAVCVCVILALMVTVGCATSGTNPSGSEIVEQHDERDVDKNTKGGKGGGKK